jgi:hypothetical protein
VRKGVRSARLSNLRTAIVEQEKESLERDLESKRYKEGKGERKADKMAWPEPRNTGMQYRRVGNSGLHVSVLGLGGWLTYVFLPVLLIYSCVF